MRQQRVYVLTTIASAITGIALILSLLSLGVDLGYHGRIPGGALAPDGRLVVPAAAVDRRALVTSGGSREGRLAAAVLDVAAPAPGRAPAPDPNPPASQPPRDRERPVQERARRLRRPGGPEPSVPAPAPVPAPAAPQHVAVPASHGGDEEDGERREREDEGSARQAGGERRGRALALGRRGGPDRPGGRQKDHGYGLGPSPQAPAQPTAFGRPPEATDDDDDDWRARPDRWGHHGGHGHRGERSGRSRGFGRGRP